MMRNRLDLFTLIIAAEPQRDGILVAQWPLFAALQFIVLLNLAHLYVKLGSGLGTNLYWIATKPPN